MKEREWEWSQFGGGEDPDVGYVVSCLAIYAFLDGKIVGRRQHQPEHEEYMRRIDGLLLSGARSLGMSPEEEAEWRLGGTPWPAMPPLPPPGVRR